MTTMPLVPRAHCFWWLPWTAFPDIYLIRCHPQIHTNGRRAMYSLYSCTHKRRHKSTRFSLCTTRALRSVWMVRCQHTEATLGMECAAKNISFGCDDGDVRESMAAAVRVASNGLGLTMTPPSLSTHTSDHTGFQLFRTHEYTSHRHRPNPDCVHILSAQNGFCDVAAFGMLRHHFALKRTKTPMNLFSFSKFIFFTFRRMAANKLCEQKPSDLFLASSINLRRIIFVMLFGVTFPHMHEPLAKQHFAYFHVFFCQRNGGVKKNQRFLMPRNFTSNRH